MPSKQPDGTFSEVIDDVEYSFQLWGAEKACNVGIQLSALLSGGSKAASDALIQDAKNTDESGLQSRKAALMAAVLGSLFDAMGKNRSDAMDVIKSLACEGVVRIDAEGKRRAIGNFNEAYRGKLGHMTRVVKAAAEVQYGDFFTDAAGFLGGS